MTMSAVPPPRVLSIAGTDPTGGAGIQADLKSIAAHRGYGMAVVTALVAQNTCGVRSVHLPPASFLTAQLEAVSDDVTVDAVKIGMLAETDQVQAVAEWLATVAPPVVVLDPVIVATSGDRLLSREAEGALEDLIPQVHLITPNVPELAVLSSTSPADSWEELLGQAHEIADRYGVAVLAKGGHLPGDTVYDTVIDPAAGEEDALVVGSPRVLTSNTHGTGCSLSAAMATLRPQRETWDAALEEAKRWLTAGIEAGGELHVGRGHGPIHHFVDLWT